MAFVGKIDGAGRNYYRKQTIPNPENWDYHMFFVMQVC